MNINFIEALIKEKGMDKVLEAGLLFLFELNEKEISLLDRSDYGTPKISLKVLFDKAIAEGYEKEIAETLVDMYKTGNKNGSFLFETLENMVTVESIPHLKKLSKEIEKRTRFSPQGDTKRKFIEKYKTEILNLIDKFKPQELPFGQPQHP
jgi:hypothetical protein